MGQPVLRLGSAGVTCRACRPAFPANLHLVCQARVQVDAICWARCAEPHNMLRGAVRWAPFAEPHHLCVLRWRRLVMGLWRLWPAGAQRAAGVCLFLADKQNTVFCVLGGGWGRRGAQGVIVQGCVCDL